LNQQMKNKHKIPQVNMKLVSSLLMVLGLAAAPAVLAQEGHAMHGTMHSAAHSQTPASRHVFMEPVQSVFDNYIKIEEKLADDSLAGVTSTATAMAKAVRGDSMHMLPAKVAEQSEALAQAKDLKSARAAFKSLSESLIRYVKQQKLPAGAYYEVYCPMAKASWLQTDQVVKNPYLGKAMPHCGMIQS
jgi:Protein of unknown function (DUF3347)